MEYVNNDITYDTHNDIAKLPYVLIIQKHTPSHTRLA